MNEWLMADLAEHQKTFANIDVAALSAFCDACVQTVLSGHKLLIFGNGGSAADAQHFAAELVGRYLCERRALPAIALSTDTSALTAIGNDYGFSEVFARQVQALAQPGDLCVGISTSGTSANVLAALNAAPRGCARWMLTSQKCPAAGGGAGDAGDAGGAAGNDYGAIRLLKAPSAQTPRIQEAHIFFIHSACAAIDRALCEGAQNA